MLIRSLFLVCLSIAASCISAQPPIPIAQPPAQDFGDQLVLDRGKLEPGDDRRVLVRDVNGKPVVGRLLVGIGRVRLVIMPDGQIRSFPREQAADTQQPFTALSLEAIKSRMLRQAKLAKFETMESRRFLYVYNTSDAFIRGTRTILETMYPAVRKYFQRTSIKTHEPEFPLVVLAFRDEADFQDFKKMAPGVNAYYSPIRNYIVLYEQSRLNQVAPEIALKNTISTIAHEGVHQILHNIGVQQRLSRWPMWLSEGLPEFFAPTNTDQRTRWKGLGQVNDLRMYEIEQSIKEQRVALGSGIKIAEVLSANKLDSLGYAYSWAMIHMLARMRQKELFGCIRACSELAPLAHSSLTEGTPSPPTAKAVFEEHFGNEYAAMEKMLVTHLKRQNYVNPVENQTHYIVIWGGRVTMTSSVEAVRRTQQEAARFGGRPTIRTFSNRRAAEQAFRSMSQ